ncbi:egg cell-secreted protein 1.1-like [Punica granatum]|uniref:Prolamin-like domain-containing protein n=2 Tax=Punica granatum TaxID=22663 RepID=A0A218XJR0_PUNGR|nr:egg cell-secreted protein 1.1-like [Punica granatum]OWM85038.1 hypothetical protein CDL15_Pgr027825 [Punica granatum]PKI57420.1 hypothetical protein CRG98_022071 [Punica granatum]
MAAHASTFSPLFLALIVLALVTGPAASQPISPVGSRSPSASDLMARLKLSDDPEAPSCWDSVFELQACTEEVITFFMSGETHLGAGCCQAIRTIEHHCWPGLIGTLGFTEEEGDILEGYCNSAIEPEG